jgi:hypothetical protein
MASSTQTFRRKVREKAAPRKQVTFTLVWEQNESEVEEGKEPEVYRVDTFHATKPTDEKMFLIAALVGDEDNDAGEAAAVVEILRTALPPEEYRIMRQRIADPDDDVDLDMLKDVVQWLIGEWTDFPTRPSSASSNSQDSTGATSTGRARGPGSIPSA